MRGLGRTWVVAVSGGSDSVGLLRVLHALGPELGLVLSVAHLDHGVRGESAREDAEFVAELARALGLPFDLGRWQLEQGEKCSLSGFEARARQARYAWLIKVAHSRGASVVSVGHTRDDQAETVLHRIVRGTGLRGLSGIPGRRNLSQGLTLVRPLLYATRGEIRDYLESLGQPYRDDATNADLTRTRARIRHDLLPRLAADYNPCIADALARLAEHAFAIGRELEDRLDSLEEQVVVSARNDCLVLDRRVLIRLPRTIRIELLRQLWRRAGWPEARVRRPTLAAPRCPGYADRCPGRPRRRGRGLDRCPDPDPLAGRPKPGSHRFRPISFRWSLPGASTWGVYQIASMLDPPPATPARRDDRQRSCPAPTRHPWCPRRRPFRSARNERPHHAPERFLPRRGDRARPPTGNPPGLRPARHHLGRRPADQRSGPAERGNHRDDRSEGGHGVAGNLARIRGSHKS